MNIERLSLMVTMLREVQAGTWRPSRTGVEDVTAQDMPKLRNFFDLNTWIYLNGDPHTCGFSACAVGHACLDERFGELELYEGVPDYGGRNGFAAVAVFFDINIDDAASLFSPDRYPKGDKPITAAQVADKIEGFMS